MPKKIYFTWGKFNLPHVGHKKIVDHMRMLRFDDEAGSDMFVFASNAMPPFTNTDKQELLEHVFQTNVKLFPKFADVFEFIVKSGYTDMVMVVGGDRVQDFSRMLGRYADESNPPVTVNVVSGGERYETDGVEGMSSTKMRQLVAEGRKWEFINNFPADFTVSYNTYMRLRFA